MYRILIVDDEPYAVDGLLHGIPFSKLGFEEVLTANNVPEARQILLTREIDVIITDIEMPNETGLDLLNWIILCGIDAVTLILTCHADFEYSRMAIKNGCIDYILKPVAYEEVAAALKKALSVAEQKRSYKSEYSEKESRARLVSNLWKALLTGEMTPSRPIIEDLCRLKGFAYSEGALYRIFIIRYSGEKLPEEDDEKVRNGIIVAVDKTITKNNGWWANDGKQIVGILSQQGERYINSAELQKRLERNIALSGGKTHVPCLAFFSQNVRLEDIAGAYKKLCAAAKSGRRFGSVEKILNESCRTGDEALPDVEYWAKKMETESADMLINSLRGYAMHSIDCEDEPEKLSHFAEICIQAMCVAASRLKIRTDFILTPSFQYKLNHASEDADAFSDFIKAMLAEYGERKEKAIRARKQPAVDVAKEYIETHLGENLQNEQIAQKLFLNADYLNRIFKKETGKTISEYVSIARIERAKYLLIASELPVSEIAFEVGFQSLSYFSKIFKKRTGTEPSKYRKKHVAEREEYERPRFSKGAGSEAFLS